VKLSATVQLRGLDSALSATLRAASQEALLRAEQEIRSRLRERYLSEGRLYGPTRLPRKTRNQSLSSQPLLVRTGRLRDSFLSAQSPDAVRELDITNPDRPALTFGSRVPYARFHQWGTRRLLARPILTEEVLGGQDL
jgi:phage gpG-like protein